jgi:methylamine---corrinoid protein Co-methyltransferase
MIGNRPEIGEILHRTQTGEYCSSKDWDLRRIPGAVRELLKKYKLEGTCTPENPVNTDFELADTFYKAGYEMALMVGYYCTDTERVVKVSQEELDASLHYAPSQLRLGEGKDGVWVKSRTPGDPYPFRVACPLGIMMSEEYFPIIMELIARERAVDILNGGSLLTINGLEAKSGTPMETYLCNEYAILHREIRRRAGRPDMAGFGCISSVTEYGQFSAYGLPGTFRPTDVSVALFPAELRIDYRVLYKVIHTLAAGGILKCDSPSMIGGMPGPPEGAVVASIACGLLSFAILHNHIGGGQIHDVRWLTNTNPEALWAQSVAQQALTRNTHLITHPIANQVSGPVTANLLYELAAGQIMLASSGASVSTTPRTAGGKLKDYITPLECRFTGEVAHSASKLAPTKANEIVKALIPKFIDRLKDPQIGLPFQEAYDLDTLTPIPEWEKIYYQVKQELLELGLDIDDYVPVD